MSAVRLHRKPQLLLLFLLHMHRPPAQMQRGASSLTAAACTFQCRSCCCNHCTIRLPAVTCYSPPPPTALHRADNNEMCGPNEMGLSRKHIREGTEAILERLGEIAEKSPAEC